MFESRSRAFLGGDGAGAGKKIYREPETNLEEAGKKNPVKTTPRSRTFLEGHGASNSY